MSSRPQSRPPDVPAEQACRGLELPEPPHPRAAFCLWAYVGFGLDLASLGLAGEYEEVPSPYGSCVLLWSDDAAAFADDLRIVTGLKIRAES